ncbi:MAG: sugar-binding transcriptional regulator [Rhodospirillales bacterium]|nr:sugar-binding transcriptional regulator [Rhodospirillales bacterium]
MVRTNGSGNRLDDAARAGWLYYVAGNTQDEIARKLGVSRQSAQRLVSLAVSEKLIKFRLDHPIARCMELSRQLSSRFGLQSCEIVPSDPDAPELVTGVAIAGAAEMQKHLEAKTPKVIALGTGRVLRACVERLPTMDCPQHHLVSLVGNMMTDGSATPYNVVVRMAERVGTRHNPMPLTVLVRNPAELPILHSQEPAAKTLELCASADATFVGIGHIDSSAPLTVDGFITHEECRALVRMGAVGEIVGWVFDSRGELISGLTNDRVSSAPLVASNPRPVIGLAAGEHKVAAILGAMHGRLVNALVTDEATAEAILKLA